jgi:hypothetical protein
MSRLVHITRRRPSRARTAALRTTDSVRAQQCALTLLLCKRIFFTAALTVAVLLPARQTVAQCQTASVFRNIESEDDPPAQMLKKLYAGTVFKLAGKPVLLLSTGNGVETFDLSNPMAPVSSGEAKPYPPLCLPNDSHCVLIEHVASFAATDDVPYVLVMATSWGWDVASIGDATGGVEPNLLHVGYEPELYGVSSTWASAAVYRVGQNTFAVGTGLDHDVVERRSGDLWIYNFNDPRGFESETNMSRRLVRLRGSKNFTLAAEVFYGRNGDRHYLLVRDRGITPDTVVLYDVSTVVDGVPAPQVVFEKSAASTAWEPLINSYTLALDAINGRVLGGYLNTTYGTMVPTIMTATLEAEPTLSSFAWGKPLELPQSQRLAQAGSFAVVTGGEPADQASIPPESRVGGVLVYPYSAFPSLPDPTGVWILTGTFQTVNEVVPFEHNGLTYVVRLMGSVGDVVLLNNSCLAPSLAVSKSGNGTGAVTSTPAGISCGSTCSSNFSAGTLVTLTATADAGSVFAGWSGEGCGGIGTCQLTMSQAHNVTAMFVPVAVSGFVPLSPCRVFDTRVTGGALTAGERRVYSLAGACALATGAIAVAANVTAVGATAAGDLQIVGGHLASTLTSVLSFPVDKARGNNAIVQLAADGSQTIAVTNASAGTVDVVFDISGYFK